MATQICPKCKEDAFTWIVDEEETWMTIWVCYKCMYRAYEDESLERKCVNCNQGVEIKLKDGTKEYRWCNKCSMITENG